MIYAFLTGLGVGAFFTFLKIPIPAPGNVEGILGIVGIFSGMLLITFLKRYI